MGEIFTFKDYLFLACFCNVIMTRIIFFQKKCSIFKIYGTLKKEGLENVLEASHLVPVQDVVGTWNLMASLSIIARSEYRQ